MVGVFLVYVAVVFWCCCLIFVYVLLFVCFSFWLDVNPELEHLLANAPKLTPEEQREWKELAKKIQDTVAPPDAIFVTVSARDQGSLPAEVIPQVAVFVSSSARESIKIGAERKHLFDTLLLNTEMEIIFEFIDPDVNRVLYWPSV
ncbi:hypothetical protein JHK85_010127 [Glycine max]|nr:hypothetical protein JHK85_010127 [Glycine max]